MKATVRSRIGPYEIVAPLGAGGMGEVYRAWDPRLHRDVALKLLPDHAASDPAGRRRFLEEARAASALSHPNILTVYDVGIDETSSFIASELIEGKRLSDAIERGPLPIRRLLDLAAQIAAGLAAAHQAGIAHRDLKPDNVMVTSDGRVKIVDFGLARAYALSAGASPDAAASQTVTSAIAGTPRYMSPEQARGGPVDFRSDQFSLGLMLYEMATGRHPFRRDTAVQTMAAIVEEEAPELAALAPRIPTVLRWTIERCLAKDPADRYASTADLARDLGTLRSRLAEIRPEDRRDPRARWWLTTTLVTGTILVLLAMTALVVASSWVARPSRPRLVPLVTDASFQGAPAWSPDGRTLAYVSPVDGILQVFTRNLGEWQSSRVTDSRFDAQDPFWARDGSRIFYHSLAGPTEGLWSISAAGGLPQPVLENASRATLSPDGSALAFLRADEIEQPELGYSLWVSSASGLDPRRYTEPPVDERSFIEGTLRFAPDGSRLLVRVWGLPEEAFGAPTPRFWIIPWPAGPPYEVLPNLRDSVRAAVAFDWLPDSRHIVAALWNQEDAGMHLWLVDTRRGRAEPLTITQLSENRPTVSPDGARVAFTSEAVDFDLFEIPLDGAPARTILATSRNELEPAFAPDGTQYAYVSDRSGVVEIRLRSRHGPWERRVVGADQFSEDDPTWAFGSLSISPDGTRVAYQRYGRLSGYRIWISTVAPGTPVQLAPGALYQDAPTWSPDGHWIAFLERQQESLRLVRVRVGSNEPPDLIRDDMMLYSRTEWSPDGRWILCDTMDGLAIVSPDGRETRLLSDELWIAYAWAADSSRVYGLREADRPRHYMLVAIDIETGDERIINPDLGIIPPAYQPIRGFSRIGDQAFATSVAGARSDILLLEGFTWPRHWWDRFWGRR